MEAGPNQLRLECLAMVALRNSWNVEEIFRFLRWLQVTMVAKSSSSTKPVLVSHGWFSSREQDRDRVNGMFGGDGSVWEVSWVRLLNVARLDDIAKRVCLETHTKKWLAKSHIEHCKSPRMKINISFGNDREDLVNQSRMIASVLRTSGMDNIPFVWPAWIYLSLCRNTLKCSTPNTLNRWMFQNNNDT